MGFNNNNKIIKQVVYIITMNWNHAFQFKNQTLGF